MADGDEQRRRHHDVTGGATKGKGRDTNDEGKQSEPRQSSSSSSSSGSLLGSALSGLGREASSSLSGLVSSQSKAGPAGSSAATAGASSSSATWSADQRSQAPGAAQHDTTGPRQGFRTAAASPPPLRDLYSDPSPRFSNLESLDQGLHELVRSQQQQSSGETGVLAQQAQPGSEATPAELLDPAYHEAWARSIPAADLSSTAVAPPASNDTTSASLAEAWNRAMPTVSGAPPPRAPTAEEPGGFMALLAAEEEAEFQEMMRPFDPQRAQQENLEFALPPRDLQAASAAGPSAGTDSTQALPYFLQEDWKQRAASDLAALRARLEGDGDEAGARRDRRRVLRLVERDLALLESRLGYAEEVWLNEAKEGPPEEADLLDDDDDGPQEAEADAEKELDERRHRALERLESLRRHLAAKL